MSKDESREQHKKIGKHAFFTFVTGAAIIYSSALYYCISTGNYFAAQLIGGAMTAVAVLVFFVYRTLQR